MDALEMTLGLGPALLVALNLLWVLAAVLPYRLLFSRPRSQWLAMLGVFFAASLPPLMYCVFIYLHVIYDSFCFGFCGDRAPTIYQQLMAACRTATTLLLVAALGLIPLSPYLRWRFPMRTDRPAELAVAAEAAP